MTTTISSRTTANANQGLADLYGAAVKSLSARNTGLQGIDAQIKRDDARWGAWPTCWTTSGPSPAPSPRAA